MMNPIEIRDEERIGSPRSGPGDRKAVTWVPGQGRVGPSGTRLRGSGWPGWRGATGRGAGASVWPGWRGATGRSCGPRTPAASGWTPRSGTTATAPNRATPDGRYAVTGASPGPSSAPRPGSDLQLAGPGLN